MSFLLEELSVATVAECCVVCSEPSLFNLTMTFSAFDDFSSSSLTLTIVSFMIDKGALGIAAALLETTFAALVGNILADTIGLLTGLSWIGKTGALLLGFV